MDHRSRAKILDVPERRLTATPFEFREAKNELILEGYASTFEPYDCYGGVEMGGWVEQIHHRAFDFTLTQKPDLQLLINHEGMPLARTKSGTLQLWVDKKGLKVRASLDPSDPDVQSLVPKMRRGDMDEMSFAFRVKDQEWNNDYTHRMVRELSLQKGDVSVVNYGMNPTTTATLGTGEMIGLLAHMDENELAEVRGLNSEDVDRALRNLTLVKNASAGLVTGRISNVSGTQTLTNKSISVPPTTNTFIDNHFDPSPNTLNLRVNDLEKDDEYKDLLAGRARKSVSEAMADIDRAKGDEEEKPEEEKPETKSVLDAEDEIDEEKADTLDVFSATDTIEELAVDEPEEEEPEEKPDEKPEPRSVDTAESEIDDDEEKVEALALDEAGQVIERLALPEEPEEEEDEKPEPLTLDEASAGIPKPEQLDLAAADADLAALAALTPEEDEEDEEVEDEKKPEPRSVAEAELEIPWGRDAAIELEAAREQLAAMPTDEPDDEEEGPDEKKPEPRSVAEAELEVPWGKGTSIDVDAANEQLAAMPVEEPDEEEEVPQENPEPRELAAAELALGIVDEGDIPSTLSLDAANEQLAAEPDEPEEDDEPDEVKPETHAVDAATELISDPAVERLSVEAAELGFDAARADEPDEDEEEEPEEKPEPRTLEEAELEMGNDEEEEQLELLSLDEAEQGFNAARANDTDEEEDEEEEKPEPRSVDDAEGEIPKSESLSLADAEAKAAEFPAKEPDDEDEDDEEPEKKPEPRSVAEAEGVIPKRKAMSLADAEAKAAEFPANDDDEEEDDEPEEEKPEPRSVNDAEGEIIGPVRATMEVDAADGLVESLAIVEEPEEEPEKLESHSVEDAYTILRGRTPMTIAEALASAASTKEPGEPLLRETAGVTDSYQLLRELPSERPLGNEPLTVEDALEALKAL